MEFYTSVARDKNNILYKGIKDGKPVQKIEKFQPTLYLVNPKSEEPYKTIYGQKVSSKKFKSMGEANFYVKQHQNDQMTIQGNTNFVSQFISGKFENDIEYDMEHIRVNMIDIETTCEDGFPDIERAQEKITVISNYDSIIKKFRVYTISDFGKTFDILDERMIKAIEEYNLSVEDFIHKNYDSEKEMLEGFMTDWMKNYPDVVTGWNTMFFDIPYLVNRIDAVFGLNESKHLSPWNKIYKKTEFVNNQMQSKYVIVGVEHLDYLDLYKKFSIGNRESYKLDFIGSYELDEKKLSYSEYANMHTFYKEDYPLFVIYNIRDVDLLVRLEDKLKYIELAIGMSYESKIPFERSVKSVPTIEGLYYNFLKERDIVFPIKQYKFSRDIEGAYVKEPIPSIYKWVVSFDLTSLYPSLMMQENISPETFIEGDMEAVDIMSLLHRKVDLSHLQDTNQTVSASGYKFDTSKDGLLVIPIEQAFARRRENKKKMLEYQNKIEKKQYKNEQEKKQFERKATQYHIKQYSQKIFLNSIYGCLANQYFVFYDTRLAESVTLHGQLVIKWSEKVLNEYFNKILKTHDVDYVIGIDTDSNYICLDNLVAKVMPDEKDENKIVEFLDKVCHQKIEPVLEQAFEDLKEYTNAKKQKMVMKREAIASHAIWTGKKRYAMNVYDQEGVRYEKPKLYIKGLETQRSDTPQPIRKALKEAISIVLLGTEDELKQHVDKTRNEYEKLDYQEISFPKGVSDITKYMNNSNLYTKGTPMHVRASILYNYYLKQKSLDHQYTSIKDGDKIKYVHLVVPNPIKENVLGFVDVIPEEFDVLKYIDRETMFEKSFIKPLDAIASIANIDVRADKVSTDDFKNALF